MENEIHIPQEAKEVSSAIDTARFKNIKEPDKYRNAIRKQILKDPKEFYLGCLIDIRMMIDEVKLNPNRTVKEIASLEKSFMEAWDRYSRIAIISDTDKAKVVAELAKSRANPEAIQEIYGETK